MERKLLENEKKMILSFGLGILISGVVICAVAVMSTNKVECDDLNTNIKKQKTKLDELSRELNKKESTWIDPEQLADLGYYMNNSHTVLANSEGVRIKRGDTLYLFKINNFEEEKNHLQQVFSDVTCDVDSYSVICTAADFSCKLYDYGISCEDEVDSTGCFVDLDGVVECEYF